MKTKSNKKQMGDRTSVSGLSIRPESSSGAESNNTNTAAPAQTPAAAPAPAQPEQTKPARILPYVNFKQREENRALSTDKVLDLLRQWLPKAYDLAEVVGKWVWVTFPDQPAEQVRGQLSQFGFHWNNSRKCWQHPCGQFITEGSGQDPRQRYGSRFAADQVAA